MSLLDSIKKVGSSTSYNDTLSSFDNEITSTKSGSSILSLSSVVSSLKKKLLDNAKNIGSSEIALFNKLKSFASSLGLESLLTKLTGIGSAFLKQLKNSAIDLLNDSIVNLENTAQNFLGNVAESIYNDLKKFIYIPDSVFVYSIKALYYSGADLAYNDNYLRKNALKRDWKYTLEFCDDEYGIIYDSSYDSLVSDLSICVKNGAWENTYYIYGKIYKSIETYNNEINKYNSELATMEEDAANYQTVVSARKQLVSNVNSLKEIMIKNLKILITYSYNNLEASDVKDFFTSYGTILKPRYYGITDDSFSQKYIFTESDATIMMPYYTAKTSVSDNETINNVNGEANELEEEIDDLSVKTSTSSSSSYTKTMDILDSYRAKALKKQSDKTKTLTRDAVTSGSGKVLTDSRARYNTYTSSGEVKYNGWWTNTTGFVSSFYDTNKYITLRNGNIKSIYVLLTSEEIFGADIMINEYFYERCKLTTMTNIMSALDKAKGIIGSSALFQNALALGEAQSGLAYNYTKSVEKYLFTPSKNNALDSSAINVLTSYGINYNPDTDSIILPSVDTSDSSESSSDSDSGSASKNETSSGTTLPQTTEASNFYNSLNAIKDSEKESSVFTYPISEINKENTYFTTDMENSIKTNPTSYKSLINIIRFLNNLSMLDRKNLLEKYITKFYTIMNNKNLNSTVVSTTFGYLIYCVFGQGNATTPECLDNIFNHSTNESLYNNIKDIMSLYIMEDSIPKYLNLESCSSNVKTTIIGIFKNCMYMMAYEIRMLSFTATIYDYDEDHYKTLTKQCYDAQITYLKSINDKTNKMYSLFYNIKDKLSLYFTGFDKSGICGYDNANDFRIKYTNVKNGDWNSILVADTGTFFGGSDNTQKNGIRYLNTSNNMIVSTQVTSGTWEIKEYNSQVFFIDNINENFYYWDSTGDRPVKITNVSDISNWELFSDESTGVIALMSKVNSGIMLWNSSSCRFIYTNATTGGNFTAELTKSGVVFYSKTTKSGIYIVGLNGTTTALSVISSDSKTYSGFHDYDEKITAVITTTTSTGGTSTGGTASGGTGSSGGTTSTVTTTISYVYHLIFASTSDGIISDYYTAESKTNSSYGVLFTVYNLTGIEGTYSYINNINNVLYAITSNGIYSITTRTTYTYAGSVIMPYSPKITVYNISTITSTLNTNIGIFKNNYFIYVNSGRLYKFDGYNYAITISCDDLTRITYKTILDYYFIIYLSSDGTKEDIYYTNKSSNEFISIFNDNKYKVSGWVFDTVDSDTLFLLNNSNSFGINYFTVSNKLMTNTNVLSGKWIIANASNKFIALSTDGSDLGIKLTSSLKSYSFVYASSNAVKSGDFKGYSYDTTKGVLYIGYERSNTSYNFNNNTFDIDEFLYNANIYQMNKILKYFNQDLTSVFLDKTNDLISGFDDSGKDTEYYTKDSDGNYTLVNTSTTSPDPSKTYYTKSESDSYIEVEKDEVTSLDPSKTYYTKSESDSYIEVEKDEVTSPDPSKTYYILDSNGNYTQVTGLTEWDPNIQYFEKKTTSNYSSVSGVTKWETAKTIGEQFDDLNELLEGSVGTLNESLESSIESSPFYTNLILLAQSSLEFDVDDTDVTSGIISNLITNDISSNVEAFNQLLSFTSSQRKYYVQNAPSEGLDYTPGSAEWNKINDNCTDDYLNND